MKNSKINIIDLRLKTNLVEQTTPNGTLLTYFYISKTPAIGKFKLKIRAIGLNFEFAEWIEKNQNLMAKFFCDNKPRHKIDIDNFIKTF